MDYRKYPPTEDLKDLVECFFTWEGDAGEELDVQTPPSGFCAIVFNLYTPYLAYPHGSNTRTSVPQTFVSGQFTSNYHLILRGRIGMAGVVLRATALYRLFGIRMSQLVNCRVPFSMLCGERSAAWENKLVHCCSARERIMALEQLVVELSSAHLIGPSVTDRTVRFIDDHHGAVTVEEVATRHGISRRHLEKQFIIQVGISPKYYARIRRFSSLSNKVAWSRKIDWQQLVFEYGFHDQSHLIREFLEFNKMNPTDYFRNHQELVRLLRPA